VNHSPARILALLLLAASGAGCQALTPQVEPGGVLFQDDFSLPISGWDRYSDSVFSTDYLDGSYQIFIASPSTEAWGLAGLEFEDVIINVSTSKASGPDDNVFGTICRYIDADNFTFFLISSDGYSGIGEYRDGNKRLISGDVMLPADAVQRGEATNHLRAECIGTHLRLIVNGVLVAEAETGRTAPGDLGLIAGAYLDAGVDVRFDQFSAIQP
jgi:hypothetical protein